MWYMDIASLPKASLRIKGKHSSIIVNPPSKKHDGNAALFTNSPSMQSYFSVHDGVILASPGEYEIGGLKIRGTKTDGQTTFSLLVDGVEVLLGRLSALEKAHSKLQEHDIVVVDVDTSLDPSFITSLAAHAVLFFGANAKEVVDSFIKENVKHQQKFVTTREKLPQEVETILLA